MYSCVKAYEVVHADQPMLRNPQHLRLHCFAMASICGRSEHASPKSAEVLIQGQALQPNSGT